jgi:hypothetical protein
MGYQLLMKKAGGRRQRTGGKEKNKNKREREKTYRIFFLLPPAP